MSFIVGFGVILELRPVDEHDQLTLGCARRQVTCHPNGSLTDEFVWLQAVKVLAVLLGKERSLFMRSRALSESHLLCRRHASTPSQPRRQFISVAATTRALNCASIASFSAGMAH